MGRPQVSGVAYGWVDVPSSLRVSYCSLKNAAFAALCPMFSKKKVNELERLFLSLTGYDVRYASATLWGAHFGSLLLCALTAAAYQRGCTRSITSSCVSWQRRRPRRFRCRHCPRGRRSSWRYAWCGRCGWLVLTGAVACAGAVQGAHTGSTQTVGCVASPLAQRHRPQHTRHCVAVCYQLMCARDAPQKYTVHMSILYFSEKPRKSKETPTPCKVLHVKPQRGLLAVMTGWEVARVSAFRQWLRVYVRGTPST